MLASEYIHPVFIEVRVERSPHSPHKITHPHSSPLSIELDTVRRKSCAQFLAQRTRDWPNVVFFADTGECVYIWVCQHGRMVVAVNDSKAPVMNRMPILRMSFRVSRDQYSMSADRVLRHLRTVRITFYPAADNGSDVITL
jgi:hypothetical protein